ncbi:endonuclease/exonuclease/phosphatase family protein [Lutibacter citreus]|uniref:endonuclease/exonuclease/phosphatase family protein n=1 Tax=Lutibacter citreus TaxID=2138210 RepID=UPI000DBE00D1|nr:endonuclease/exonuclease/phosphatase family protein [Lutibacter citreus]
MFSYFKSSGKNKQAYTIAFYNLENLFDIKNDPNTLDDDFTPKGKKKWNYKKYKRKLKKLGNVIAQLGTEKSFYGPAIVGLVEVENQKVVEDLITSNNLKNEHYGIVHYDSPDERGIDVALLYKKELFELLDSETFPLYLEGENGERDYTRDVLLVKGNLNGELVFVLVNHWPSRRSGVDMTEEKRIKAAELVVSIVDKIESKEENPKIIIMGDFNDDPTSKSIKNHLVTENFYNPMERLIDTGNGSSSYKKDWHLFDQIIFSKNFINVEKNKHSFKYAEVFDRYFLKEWKGKYKGNPFRTFAGKWYLGGFSDHFPVYVYLKKND